MRISKLLFILCIFFLSLGQFAAISKTGFANYYLFDFFIFLFVLYGFYFFFVIKKVFVLPSVSLLLLAFSFIAVISLIKVSYFYNSEQLLVSFFYLLRWLMYLFSGIIVYNFLYQEEFSSRFIINSLLFSGLFLSFFGFIQLVVFPDLGIIDKLLGWDPHKNRLFSTFLDPNFLGAFLNLSIFYLIDKHYSKSKLNLLGLFTLGILIIALFLTFSRSAWMMFSILILIYGLLRSKALLLTFVIIAFATYFAIPRIQTRLSGITDPNDSAHYRLISWQNTLKMAQDNIFLGVGFNTFRYAQKEYGLVSYDEFSSHGGSGSDSSLLFVLATTGILGFICFVSSLVYAFIKSKSLFIKSLILGLIAESFFINSLFFPQILFVWIILIISYSFFDN